MLCRDHHELLQGLTFPSQLPRREWTCKSCAFASWRSLLSQPCPCRKDKGKEKVKEKGAQTDVLIRWPASIENSEFLFFGWWTIYRMALYLGIISPASVLQIIHCQIPLVRNSASQERKAKRARMNRFELGMSWLTCQTSQPWGLVLHGKTYIWVASCFFLFSVENNRHQTS